MTSAEQTELINLVAESVAKSQASQDGNWWALLNSWGPAITVPVLTLVAVLFGCWRGLPRIMAWLDTRDRHREEREDELRNVFIDALREVAEKSSCHLADHPVHRINDSQTPTTRLRRVNL